MSIRCAGKSLAANLKRIEIFHEKDKGLVQPAHTAGQGKLQPRLNQMLTEKSQRFVREQPCSKHIQSNDLELQGNDVGYHIFCSVINERLFREFYELKTSNGLVSM